MTDASTFDWASFVRSLEGADRQDKASILAQVAHELTVLARDTYDPGSLQVSDPRRLRAINEVMHRLTRRFLNLSRGKPDDWNEAEFWQVLSELSEQGDGLGDLVTAASIASRGQTGP